MTTEPANQSSFVLQLAAVAVGGAAGSVARSLTTRLCVLVGCGDIGWPTLAVNLTGSLLIGWLLGPGPDPSSAAVAGLSPLWRAGLVTGLLGGLTTFSALAYETVLLAGPAARGSGWLFLIANLTLGLAAVWLGMRLPR